MKITALEMANVKRIKALRLEPTQNGLTVIGGRNAQGKTSVLDAIAYALGGEKYRPTNLRRDGAVAETTIHVETDDGLVIDRKGKNSSLTVTDRDGRRCGQQLLDAVVGKLAIDLPKFLDASDREKAEILLRVLGVGDRLAAIELKEKSVYDTRTAVGRMAEQKKKAAADMPWHDGLPSEPVSISDLVKRQQDILARNGLRAEHRRVYEQDLSDLERTRERIDELRKTIGELERKAESIQASIAECDKDFTQEDTSELEAQIADFEETNRKISENAARTARENEADDLQDQYDTLTVELDGIRKEKADLLEGADLPYPGLSVSNGVLTLDGKSWDCMSGAQQMIVATAIAARVQPTCGFVLLDKLEQLDVETMREFDSWLREHGLQCLATRVSTGDECSIVIEDGEAVEQKPFVRSERTVEPLGEDDY